MSSLVTSNNNSDEFQSVQKRYDEYNNVIQCIAKQFRAVRHIDLHFLKNINDFS